MKHTQLLLALTLSLSFFNFAYAGNSSTDEIEKYRELLSDGNPAEFAEIRGEELWQTKAGPKNVSLAECDLGKGPGVLAGAYVGLPKYFEDTKKVMDLEQRLIFCRMTLQGLTEKQATNAHFASAGHPSDIEPLVAYIAGQSKGMKVAISTKHPLEQKAYELGKKLFFYRAGSHDFACATCHSTSDGRIRLQQLSNLLNKKDAQDTYATWPAYRVSQGEVRTMQHRLSDCMRQQRFPEPNYASDTITSLIMYLAKNADGSIYAGPGIKR